MSFEQEPIDNIIYFVEQQNGMDVLYALGRKGKVPIAERISQNGDKYVIFYNVWVNPEDPGNLVDVRIRLSESDRCWAVITETISNTSDPDYLRQLRCSAQAKGGYPLSVFLDEKGMIDFEQAWHMFDQPPGIVLSNLPQLPIISTGLASD